MTADKFDIFRALLQIFDRSVDSMAITNTEGRLLYVNEATVAFAATTVPEVLGKLIWEAFPDTAGPVYEEHFRRAVREQASVVIEFYFPPPDLWFEARFYPSPDFVAFFPRTSPNASGPPKRSGFPRRNIACCSISVDEGFCVCEMIWDAKGKPIDYRFLEVNPVFEQMTGFTNAEGKTVKELAPGLEDWWVQRYAQIVNNGESARFQHGSEFMG